MKSIKPEVGLPQIVEDNYQKIIENYLDGIIFLDSQGVIAYINPRMSEILGYTIGEVLGKEFSDFLFKEDLTDHSLKLKNRRLGINERYERRIRCKDGSEKWMLVSAMAAKDEKEEFVGSLATFTDITSQKRLEASLREDENRYEVLLESAPVPYHSLDASGIFLYVNQPWLDLLGYTRKEVIGHWFEDFLALEEKDKFRKNFARFKALGKTKVEFNLIRKDGSLIAVEFDGKIGTDALGHFKQTHCILQDITERKRAEGALRESETRFRGLFEDSPISLWEEDLSAVKQRLDILREQGVKDFRAYFETHQEVVAECGALIKILNVNKASVKLLHAKSKKEIFENFSQVFGGEQFTDFTTELVNIAEGKTEFEWEGVNHALDGVPLVLNLRWSAAPEHEETLAKVFISVIDVTERRQAETLLREKERQVSTLMSNLPGMVYRCLNDQNWTTEFVSEGSLTLTGFSPEDFISDRVHYNDLVLADDQAMVRDQIQQALQERRPFQFTYRIHTKSGQLKWVWEQGRETIFLDAKKMILEGFISDITERKLAEQAVSLMSEVQKQIVQLNDLIAIYQLVGQKIYELIGDGFVVVSTLDEEGQAMEVIGQYGFGDLLDDLPHLFKFDPSRITFNVKDMAEEELQRFRSGRLEKFESGLYQLLSHKYPKSLCNAAEKQFKITGVYTMGFAWHGLYFGNLTILAKSDISAYVEMIETIMNQAAISINRIRSEKELRDSEERFRRVFEESPVGMGLANAAYKFISVNKAFCKMLGYSEGEFLTLSFKDITHPDHLAQDIEAVNKISTGDLSSYTTEKRYLHKDGRIVWGNATITAIHDQRGGLISYLAMVEDITERKRAEVELSHERYLMNALMETIPDAVYFKDLQSRFIRVNQGTAVKTGLKKPEEVEGKTDFDFFVKEVAQEYFDEEQQITQTGQAVIGLEELEIWPDRPPTWASTTKMPMRDETGKIIGTFGISRDITERKKHEEEIKRLNADLEKKVEARTKELKLKNQELESFTYSISHDLKAPLRGISGYSRLLLTDHADQLDDEGEIFLNRLIQSSEYLSQLIDDLLAYSRLERKPVNRVDLSTKEIIRIVVEERNQEIIEKKIQLHLDIEEETINSSSELLTRILRNYLDNAIKFLHTIEIPEIWLSYHSQNGGGLFSVRDNGIGFDMVYSEKIFDVFQRLHRQEKYPGTGIGLALAKKAADLLGYRVWAESTPGSGATFYLEIKQ